MSTKRKYYQSTNRRRRRFAAKTACVTAAGAGTESATMAPSASFTKVLKHKSQLYTAYTCQLILPMLFCDKHKVEQHITMTDSAGHKLWHMLLQQRSRTRGVYRIGNGWREFSFDHSLERNHKLVFNLVNPSHFVVQFADSDGFPLAVLPTRVREDYPWRVRDKLAAGETGRLILGKFVSTPSSFTKILRSKTLHSFQLTLPKLFCEEHNVEVHITMTDSTKRKLWHMHFQTNSRLGGIYHISSGWREFAYDHSLQCNDTLVFSLESPSHFLVEFADSQGLTRAMRPTRDGTDYPWRRATSMNHCFSRRQRSPQSIQPSTQSIRSSKNRLQSGADKAGAAVAAKQNTPQAEIGYCQCNAGRDSTKSHQLREWTHVECRNADGSAFVQTLESDDKL